MDEHSCIYRFVCLVGFSFSKEFQSPPPCLPIFIPGFWELYSGIYPLEDYFGVSLKTRDVVPAKTNSRVWRRLLVD